MERLLLISAGDELYRRYALQELNDRYEVLLISRTPANWAKEFVADAVAADVTDTAAVVQAAVRLRSRHHIDGVLTWDEAALGQAAAVAAKLGLVSPPETVLSCRDKWLQRQAFAAAGVPSARAQTAFAVDEAERHAATIGYPVVVKPRRLAGSVAVRLAEDPAAVRRAAAAALSAGSPRLGPAGGVVVEEFLDGPEISVDSWVGDGDAEPVFLAHKDTGFPPYFEETGHLVPADVDTLLWEAVRNVVVRAHAALGLSWLVTHTELRLTADGPKVIEVNGRLGGDLIPYLGYLASGRCLAAAAGDVALGQRPRLERRRRHAAGVAFCYPPQNMRLERVEFDPALAVDPHVVQAIQMEAAGTELLLPPRGFTARAAMVIVTADTTEACRESLVAVRKMITIEGSPA